MIVVVGYASVDRSRGLDRLPSAGVTSRVVEHLDTAYRPGGIAHTALALIAGSNAHVVPVCSVGTDEPGSRFIRSLAAAGCDTVGIDVSGDRSPTTDLLYDEAGDTACVFDPGTGWLSLTPDQQDLIARADLVVSMIGPEQVTADTLAARRDDADLAWIVKVDPSSQPASQTTELGKHAGIVFHNTAEAPVVDTAVAGSSPTRVCTDGPRPVTVTGSGTTQRIAIPKLDRVVNPTGAGDTFAGGYLARRQTDPDPTSCVLAGAEAVRGLLDRGDHR